MKWAVLTLILCLSCKLDSQGGTPAPSARVAAGTTSEGERTERAQLDARSSEKSQAERCLSRYLALSKHPEAAEERRRRAEILARARAEPVFFWREPEPTKELTPVAAQFRKELESSAALWDAFHRLIERFAKEPASLREVVLTDGYLYARRPDLASLYANHLTLGLLFREPVLELQRGNERFRLVRGKRGYEHDDGPERGKPARLLLFDRVWPATEKLGPALHVDVKKLAHELRADEIAIEGGTEQDLAAELRYGKVRVKAHLTTTGGALQLGCQAIFPEQRDEVELSRNLHARHERAVEALRSVIREQVDEGLPFDEPKTEDGQQDGKLRPAWRDAYRRGHSRYEFNEDKYSVFDRAGRPHVPQVCIDFITDTFERASGTWYRARGEARERVLGSLDFDDFSLENKRSVEQFLAFASSHSEAFEVHDVPPEERIPLRNRARFFGALYEQRERYRPGDIVVIYGLRDDELMHYHSFFVYESDPLTGMPTLVAANAGRPRIRTWENEMQNAPRRSIFARIRPRIEWLETHIRTQESLAAGDQVVTGPG